MDAREYRKAIDEICDCRTIDDVVRINGKNGCLKLTKINGRVALLGFENSRCESGVIEVDLAPEEFAKLF